MRSATPGSRTDSADGTVYLRARAYSPALGRFLQRDSFGGYGAAPQTLNRYAYAGNNPATNTDLSGHDFFGDVQHDIGWLNERIGPRAIEDSWNWHKRVLRPVWKQITQPCTLDAIQTALDVLGVIPGFGTPFDLANAAISIARGNHTDAAMRLLFALPGIGDAAGATHLASRATHLVEEGAEHFGDDALRALGRACGANSFSADTLVATPDGEQPISTLQVGDQVLAYNQETGTTGAYTVTAVLVHDDPAQLHLTIDGETLDTTPEHPFYTLLRGWVAATALRVGDQVQREDGSYGAVEAVRLDPTPRRMYNLTVAEAHTFFVGEQHWLVHNAKQKCDIFERFGSEVEARLSFKEKGLVPKDSPHQNNPKWIGEPGAQDPRRLSDDKWRNAWRMTFKTKPGTLDWVKQVAWTKPNEANRYGIPADLIEEFNKRVLEVLIKKR